MQVAFFTNYIYNPHFETELELIQEHLNKGDQVVHFVCDRDLLSCDFNPGHDLLKCRFCTIKRKEGVRLLTNKDNYTSISISTLLSNDNKNDLRLNFDSLDELKDYQISNFEIGFAALSSLVSLSRDPEPDLRLNRDLLNRIIRTSYFVYYAILNYLSGSKIDNFYVFNGRFAINRAIFRACLSKGVEAIIHERGHDYKHYALYSNVMPHDIAAFIEMVGESWQSPAFTTQEKQQDGEKFYIERLNGKEQSWFSYTENQQKGMLPVGWDPADENLVIFNSSEDEFVAIGDEWNTDLYDSQLSILNELAHLDELNGVKIWLRMHPNMNEMSRQYLKKYEILKGTKINLIAAESLVSSYDLLLAASKILTFGSTIGIEATFWGKPSILYGKSYYKDMDVTYNPSSLNELVELIISTNLKPKPKENTLAYGFYLSQFGLPYKIYEPTLLKKGTFKGKELDESFNLKWWQKISEKRGIHRLYNKLNKIIRNKLNKRYI